MGRTPTGVRPMSNAPPKGPFPPEHPSGTTPDVPRAERTASHAPAGSPSDQPTLGPGVADLLGSRDAIPGYELLAELGRGGMGVVYEARQVKANRLVALKMILAGGHAGAAELARFRTEAEALARLQHPNIVQIFEVSEHAGRPFFSMELCGGGSLAKKLRGTPLPAREAARLVRTLAGAVQAAHQA